MRISEDEVPVQQDAVVSQAPMTDCTYQSELVVIKIRSLFVSPSCRLTLFFADELARSKVTDSKSLRNRGTDEPFTNTMHACQENDTHFFTSGSKSCSSFFNSFGVRYLND